MSDVNVGDSLMGMLQTSGPKQPASLASLVDPGPKRGMFSVLLGPAGAGKSSFCAEWPDCEFITDPKDQGILDLKSEGLIKVPDDRIHICRSYDGYKNNLEIAVRSKSKTLVCESMIGIQSLCWDHVSKTHHKGDTSHNSFLNYQAGPIQATDHYYSALLDLMREAQSNGKHVWLIGHTRIGAAKTVVGDDRLIAKAAFNTERLWDLTEATCMNVFVLAMEFSPGAEVNKTTSKVTSDFNMWMFGHKNPHYPSKNRMGIKEQFIFPSSPREAYLKFCEVSKRDPKTGYRKA